MTERYNVTNSGLYGIAMPFSHLSWQTSELSFSRLGVRNYFCETSMFGLNVCTVFSKEIKKIYRISLAAVSMVTIERVP